MICRGRLFALDAKPLGLLLAVIRLLSIGIVLLSISERSLPGNYLRN